MQIMQQSYNIFELPATGFVEVWYQAWMLFMGNFGTLAVLGFLHGLALMPVNHLLSISLSISTRLIDDGTLEHTIIRILGALGLMMLCTISMSFLGAIYWATCIRAVGEVYGGQSPTWKGCLGCALGKLKALAVYQLLVPLVMIAGMMIAIAAIVFLSLMYPFDGEAKEAELISSKALFLLLPYLVPMGGFGFSMMFFLYATCFTLNAIVLENKDAISAAKRSWSLCKSRRWSVIWPSILVRWFCWWVSGLTVTTTMTGETKINHALSILLSPLIGAPTAVVDTVIYMALCIQKDRITMQEFQLCLDPVKAVRPKYQLAIPSDDDIATTCQADMATQI